ncbi:MAG: helix-hairpin-helix domain-containing protein [Myxococcales bacterium]|nr:helix-hairpin-helix domain-containing protein [Myxococcales bacterium]
MSTGPVNLACARARITAVLRGLARSPWAGPAGRALFAGLALVVLSAIGGSALAGAAATGGTTGPPDAQGLSLPEPTTAPTVLAETVIVVPRGDGGAGTQAQAAATEGLGKATEGSPVGLNTATLDDLRRLPGIGPKKAAAILALRAKLGRFRRAEELMRVKGIGRGTFKKLRPLVKVDEPPAG